ncbi:peptidyl-Lys metalloendopeptidase [Trametopsis cervina]|nr:peptidyl-Lys metalloendopeptidase [Trametopsis cervina]
MFVPLARSSLLVLFGSVWSASAAPGLSLKLSGAQKVSGVSNLKVTATVTNTGDDILKLLNDPRGPLSKFPTETFEIAHQDTGASPTFTGVKVKYVPEVAIRIGKDDAFTVLAPGESISVEHDLSEAYDFATSGEGTYTVAGARSFSFIDPSSGTPANLIAKDVQPHVLAISGELTVPRPTQTKRETYTGCGVNEQSTITAAAAAAQSYAAASFNYLQTHTASTPRFTTWFGKFSAADRTTVLTHFTNLNNNSYASYSFDCTCTDSGVYAYVRPDVFGKVTVCGAFWQAPVTGTDSQGGTLIHESTHFIQNAGTQDYVYGQTDAMGLAQSNPTEAINNADNHEYFAENNPVLS